MRPFWVFSICVAALLSVSSLRVHGYTPAHEDRVRVFVSRAGDTVLRLEAGRWNEEAAKEEGATATVLRFDARKSAYEKAEEFSLQAGWLPDDVVLTDRAEFIVVFNSVAADPSAASALVVYRTDGSIAKQWSLLEIAGVADRIQVDLGFRVRWTRKAIMRWIGDRGVVLIWLFSDRDGLSDRGPDLRLELPSLTLVRTAAR